MRTIITDLWQGNITPARNLEEHIPGIKEILGYMEAHSEKLDAQLDEAHREVFEKYRDCAEEYLDLAIEQAFYEGFCLGGRFFAAVLTSPNPGTCL